MAREDSARTPKALREQLLATRKLTLDLAARLSDADATIQPFPDASPAKWHLAHTTWFFETFVLRDHVQGYRPREDGWAYLFNSYYDGEGERHPRARRGMLSRPSLAELLDYRSRVDEALFAAMGLLSPAALRLVELGLNHEQQHQELMLTDMLATFAENPLRPAIWPSEPGTFDAAAVTMGGVRGAAGLVEIGHDGSGFAFDCEGPRHRVFLHPHELADRTVTNGEWMRFIEEGGYSDSRLWLADGYAWVRENKVEAPLYWQWDEGRWLRFGLDGLHPVDRAAPVTHVSYYEADAFARWAGVRLPTEFEWEKAAACDLERGIARLYPWGSQAPTRQRANLDQWAFGPAQIGAYPEGRSFFGCEHMLGDVWEWTASEFLPYPDFEAFPYPEYSAVHFGRGYKVLRGGSWATRHVAIRNTFRNWDLPQRRQIFAGFRCAADA
jgi:ergothioneine biosynthesis protein EgtB